jgi:thiamine pyrophosphate-dependent acetolactate synthase large subunit-like protein
VTVPAREDAPMKWGSDAMAEVLRATGVSYLSLNPGASYRGLHDSLVNRLGNERPEMVLCLHEEHAVAIAHGYAKVTGRPMAVALHSNVGLMHASMAIYNAYCDRVPMLILGAMGPWDAAQRRPWIDWIHTSADQAALIRPYIKWDDQPGSVAAALESLARASMITRTYPEAPAYVCLDAALQEEPLERQPVLPDLDRHRPPAPPTPGPDDVEQVMAFLCDARRPALLVGRVGRDERAWEQRVQLAQRTGATVVSDLKTGSTFPTAHLLHAGPPAYFPAAAALAAIRDADLVVALDWIDLGGTLRAAIGDRRPSSRIVACSCDFVLHNGWTKDHFELSAIDLPIASHPDLLVEQLVARLPGEPSRSGDRPSASHVSSQAETGEPASATALGLAEVAASLRAAVAGRPVTLARLPLGWPAQSWDFTHPLDFLGLDGGGGIGSGPGMAVGAALALRGSDRLTVAVIGDGDFLMGAGALWSAAHQELPLLVVVVNNGTYRNDEVHQGHIARVRGRPAENRWVGQRISDPRPDLAQHARSLGLVGLGPVADADRLAEMLRVAVAAAERGPVVVDVHIAVDV